MMWTWQLPTRHQPEVLKADPESRIMQSHDSKRQQPTGPSKAQSKETGPQGTEGHDRHITII
jgi:hypothetical protein